MGTAVAFIVIHITVSLTVFSPLYYEKLFVNGKLTMLAGISMMIGAIATALLVADGNNGVKVVKIDFTSHPTDTPF